MDRKIRVDAGQSGKEMKFPRVDRCFSGVSAMDVGRRKLVVNCDGLHVEFEVERAFVVKDL